MGHLIKNWRPLASHVNQSSIPTTPGMLGIRRQLCSAASCYDLLLMWLASCQTIPG
ncbi:hypothetical protein C8R21_12817 [Nitrosospira multiformis]|uniref:Uncharacterized protein n=1 Tax=Nitrosospira multiformis TaxID=1231 RepID=A0A2T5I6J4_9PROT|nr:hypothetical protein C8R21_12817 [Nitrosospira multiformis]